MGTEKHQYDFLVIGSGLAGLNFALEASRHGTVAVVSKGALEESNTLYAQGGVAAVVTESDSFDLHVEDTLKAGAGLCHEEAVRTMVEGGPEAIQALVSLGADFTRRRGAGDRFDLGKEGGHSRRRIVHAADQTGREVERALLAAVRERSQVHLFPHHMTIDLLLHSVATGEGEGADRCLGAYVLDRASGEIHAFSAHCTVLATGGAGKVYLYTTNPDVATGDGVAMAYRAYCSVANLEFFQFHPTCLYHPHAKSFLISEAVRGEGGVLRNAAGDEFMKGYHPMRELAPRDVVARAIDQEMKESGEDCVFLDVTHKDPDFMRDRFPNIHARCLSLGVDMTKEPIPVVPAAHYMCGGVCTDLNGRTDLDGLFAVGEVTHTGVHGANRLASNSLLESLVFSRRAVGPAVEWARKQARDGWTEVAAWDTSGAVPSDESVVVSHSWDEIRRFMWNYVGIFRSETRLRRAMRRVELIREEIKDYYWKFIVTSDLLELRNILQVAELIVQSALARRESRGLHYNYSHPDRDDAGWARDTVLRRPSKTKKP